MHPHSSFAWKKVPFFRLLLPFTLGIVTQYYSEFQAFYHWLGVLFIIAFLIGYSRLSQAIQFRHRQVPGSLLIALLFQAGCLLTFYNDIRHQQQWFGHVYQPGDTVQISLDAPLVRKDRSYKALATVQLLYRHGKAIPVQGRLALSLHKDSLPAQVGYGTTILLTKPLRPVVNTGNPGAFNYPRYMAFQHIWHQVYLLRHEYFIAEKTQTTPVKNLIFRTREKVLYGLKKYIVGNREAGLAEALLIGYKDDLDRSLLQAYTETGIVHIIAVSGQHLALLYGIFLLLSRPLQKGRRLWTQTLLLLAGIWLFSLLAGAGPSILRSAVMFSFVIASRHLPGHYSIYNALAGSAFLLLCFNPYWLWDAGFQLSYAAVLSLALFMQPVYSRFTINNKILDGIWKLMATTIAAQVLTIPLSVWHFHQLPHLFLLTNLVAVPLSAILLTGELILCALLFIPLLAAAIGWLLTQLITGLNHFIEMISQLPFHHSDYLQLSGFGLLIMYIGIACLSGWWLFQQKKGLLAALACCWLLLLLQAGTYWMDTGRKQWIVYNVPGRQAMDFVTGRTHLFAGDPEVVQQPPLYNFYLKPARTALRMASLGADSLLLFQDPLCRFGGQTILLADQHEAGFRQLLASFSPNQSGFRDRIASSNTVPPKKQSPGDGIPAFTSGTHRSTGISSNIPPTAHALLPIDHILLSHNPSVSIKSLINVFACTSVVIDASNSRWKTSSWMEECHQLGIACHPVSTQGAFVLKLH